MKYLPLFLLIFASCQQKKTYTANAFADITFQPPLTITKGGHYTGSFKSTNASIPAITISTTDSVWLDNINAYGQGDCIHANGGAKIIANNVYCETLPPIGTAQRGWGFYAYKANYISLTNFSLLYCNIRLDQAVTNRFLISKGTITNVSRLNGLGGIGKSIAPGLQLNDAGFTKGSEISWIYFLNEPNKSCVEDNINVHNSGGTAASPLLIHDLCINGAYPFPADSSHYSGTGITMDGSNNTYATTTQFVNVYNCTFVRTMNAAMNLPTGHDIHYENNRIVNAGYIGNKQYLPMSWSGTANWDMNKAGAAGMYNNTIQNNYIGYYHKGVNYKYANRQDENQQSGSFLLPHGLNTYFPDREITISDEDAEVASFWAKAAAAGISIGSSSYSQPQAPQPPVTTPVVVVPPSQPVKPDTVTLPAVHDTLPVYYYITAVYGIVRYDTIMVKGK